MAIYHLHVGTISRATGRSSVAAAAYRSGEKLHNEYDGITHDYTNRSSINAAAYRAGEQLGEYDFTNKRGVVYSEIILPENAPSEFSDRGTLWNAVEKSEQRRNARTARDIDIALPVEFSRQEHIDIARKYIQENFVKYGMIADFAIHDKGDGNPHVHILLTTRDVDENGFKGKNRDWDKKGYLQSWRVNWANICNEHLKEKGYSDRIDHRTLKAQGIDREPTIHIGVTAKAMSRKGIDTDRMREHREITVRNEAKSPEKTAEYMHELKQGYVILDREITALKQESAETEREIRILRFKTEEMTQRAEEIDYKKNLIDRLKSGRQKPDKEQMRRLEYSLVQAEKTFRREYDVAPEQAAEQAKRLEDRARSLGHLKERLQDKLTPFAEEKDIFMLEYQRQKLLVEISPYRQRIYDRLAQLEKGTPKHTVQERIAYARSERTLNIVLPKSRHQPSERETSNSQITIDDLREKLSHTPDINEQSKRNDMIEEQIDESEESLYDMEQAMEQEIEEAKSRSYDRER